MRHRYSAVLKGFRYAIYGVRCCSAVGGERNCSAESYVAAGTYQYLLRVCTVKRWTN